MKQHRSKIKNALSKDVPNWDDSDVWKGIENTLPPEKRNNKGFLYFIAIAIVFMIIGYSYLDKKNNISNSKNKTQTSNSNSTVINNEVFIEYSPIKTEKQKIKGLDKPIIYTKRKNDLNKYNSRIKKANFNSNILKKVKKQNTLQINKNKLVNIVQVSNKVTTNYLQAKNINTGKNIWLISKLNQNIKEINIPKIIVKIDTPEIISVKKEIRFKSEPKYSLDFNSGVYYTKRSLSSSSYSNWIEKKNKSETILETTDLFLSITRYFNNRISVSVGVQYSQIIEEFIHTDSTISISKIFSDTAFIFSNGVYTGGMVNKTTTDYRTIKSPNRFKYLSIPIGIYYYIPIRKNQIQLGGGINIDLWSKYTGYSLDFNNKTINSHKKLDELYKRPIGISSVFISVKYKFKLKNKFMANIGIKSTMDIMSSNRSKKITQKYNQYGINLGLSYLLK